MKFNVQPKRLITAGGTLMCALGIGYFMQNAAEAPAPQAPAQNAEVVTPQPEMQAPELAVLDEQGPSVELNEITLTSAASSFPKMSDLSSLPLVQAALDALPSGGNTASTPQEQLTCDYALAASVEPAAMVQLTLDAPCMSNERFTIHHNGMMVSQATDDAGQSSFILPALAETAVYIVAFGNGEGAVATAEVPSLANYDRAVVQWRGESGMQLHAFEYDADYDTDGHVWVQTARDASAATLGEGGFVSQHGMQDLEDALVAQVYTFPTGTMSNEGEVTLSVETEVTAANCGRDVEAQSIQKEADGGLKTQNLVLAMPDCNAVGDFLVLKNLLNGLKIASK